MYKEFKLPASVRELFFYRIINGYIKYNDLIIRTPTKECMYEAQSIYVDMYNQAIENEIITEQELLKIVIDLGEWNDYDEDQLINVLPKHVEFWQKDIFNSFNDKTKLNQIYMRLNVARKELNRLFNKKNHYNHLTAEGLALFAKVQYIVEHSTYHNGKSCDWSIYDIKELLSVYNDNYIDDTTIRYLSRTYPWMDTWSISKKTNNLFDKATVDLSDEQKRIIGWSILYDNIREYEDYPGSEMVACDDAIDGWLLIKHEERDRERRLKNAEGGLGVAKNSSEVFIVTKPEKAKEIYELNTAMSRNIVKSRLDVIEKKGVAKDTDFADVRQQISMARTNMEAGKM